MIHPHGIFQYRLIQQHLYLIILLRLHLAPDRILVSFARLHFYEGRHIALHIVQAALQSQSFTDIGRFQYGIRLIQFITGSTESLRHRLSDMVEVPFTISEEFLFLFFIQQISTRGQINGIGTERFLHTSQIVRFLLGIDPLIQKKIGDVSKQQRTRIVRRLQACQQIIGRMMPVILKALCQRADIQQIVRFQYNKGRRQYTSLIYSYIQQVNLRMTPQQFASLGKFLIHLRYIVAYPQRFIGNGIYRQYI